MRQVPYDDWLARGKELFGENRDDWKFICVACGHAQSLTSVRAKRPDLERKDVAAWIFFACEGRHIPTVGCNWSLGGLFHFHNMEVLDEGKPVAAFEYEGDVTAARYFYMPAETPATKKRPHAKGQKSA